MAQLKEPLKTGEGSIGLHGIEQMAGPGLGGVWAQSTAPDVLVHMNGAPWGCAVCNLCGRTWLSCPGFWFMD